MSEQTHTIKAADLRRVGMSKVYAHQLASGMRTPSLELALKIERELGVPPSAWPLPRKPANDSTTTEAAA